MTEQDGLRRLIGVQTIWLHQLLLAAHPLHQEWHVSHPPLCGESGKNLLKCFRILPAVVRRQFHAQNQDLCASSVSTAYDLAQIGLHLRWLQSPESIIGTQLDDDDCRLHLLEQLVDPAESASGRFARDAGVNHPVAPFRQPVLQQSNPSPVYAG